METEAQRGHLINRSLSQCPLVAPGQELMLSFCNKGGVSEKGSFSIEKSCFSGSASSSRNKEVWPVYVILKFLVSLFENKRKQVK